MTREKEILSDLIVFSKYAKYSSALKRRETWNEIVDRYEGMMVEKYSSLTEEIIKNAVLIREKKVLPSMRALQFSGMAMELNNARGYNCCYLPIDSVDAFNETMFLLLGGTGVGYSVQTHHIQQLPVVIKPTKTRRYVVQDSIIGWADAVKALIRAYMEGKSLPIFDFRDIRPKGARLVTAGGKAPGPEPLKECLFEIQKVLDRKIDGDKLTSLEAHDILCHIANSVLAGGIRRAAMICLFSLDDEEMLTCKYGNWWEMNEQRGRANNSAVLERDKITEGEFKELWRKIEASNSGEPGFYFTNNRDWGTNPCCEVALRPYQFCNLCEINADNVIDQEDLNNRALVASFFGTLQAGFTDFHYLRNIWKKTTEEDALVGVGMTGIASGAVLNLDLVQAAEIVKEINASISAMIGINQAARTTLIKPAGTTSLVLGASSGIHDWYAQWFLRTIRFNKNEDIAQHLMINHPELMEDDILRPTTVTCARIPMKAPSTAIVRGQGTALDLLERVKKFSTEWVKTGHRDGDNTHNVSATISIQPGEWDNVGKWMWKNRKFYNGLSVLPADNGSYVQAPFEECSESEYKKRSRTLQDVDLTMVIEVDDYTTQSQEAACSGGKCEIV